MSIVSSYLRLILFLTGVLAAVQIPMFIDQYGKRLESHFIESEKGISNFKDEARKYFGGSMEKLIAHYRQSGDPVFHDGGESIQAIYSRYLALQKAMEDFRKGAWHAALQAFWEPVPDIQKEVREGYTYSVRLDLEAIVTGIIGGFVLAVSGEAIFRAAFAVLLLLTRRAKPERQLRR